MFFCFFFLVESKCEFNFCRNGGVCMENIDNYICLCVVGFMGKNCECEWFDVVISLCYFVEFNIGDLWKEKIDFDMNEFGFVYYNYYFL